jgi:hypothetical protein
MSALQRFPLFALATLVLAGLAPAVFPATQIAISKFDLYFSGQILMSAAILIPPPLWILMVRYGIKKFGRRGWWLLLAAPISFSIWMWLGTYLGEIAVCDLLSCPGS